MKASESEPAFRTNISAQDTWRAAFAASGKFSRRGRTKRVTLPTTIMGVHGWHGMAPEKTPTPYQCFLQGGYGGSVESGQNIN